MGVRGLHTFVEHRLPPRSLLVTLDALATECGAADTVVVDGMALIRRVYPQHLDWLGGGQFQAMWQNVADFVRAFARARLRLVVFFDGGVDDAKLDEWLKRRRDELGKCRRAAEAIERGEVPGRPLWSPPLHISRWVGGAFADNGCAVFYTAGEADREMAQYCRDTPSCGALLGKDSDFFVLPVARYLPLDSLDLRASTPRVTVYRRADVLDALQLDEPLLPLLASLVGNDFVPTDVLDAFHRALVGPDRHASGQPLILAVAAHLRSAAASTGWCGGLPLPPLLWDALDFARRLPEGGKALVERSLEQYALSEAFAELPARWREIGGAGVSEAMLRRFRAGRLDSAIFTAAARGAIWRGPGLDLSLSNGEGGTGVAAAILASRPVRAEIYACCVEPPAAAAAEAAKAHEVREFVVYARETPLEEPDVVRVPPAERRCEQIWALPSDGRCACLLRSLARASADDALLARADPRPYLALGPLSLALLTTRFLGRARLEGGVPLGCLLCQAVVMAWLSHRRQQLPESLRGGAGRAYPLRAIHAASLYLRTSSDIVTLNSACGEALKLAGAWQWYDGVLFHSMLAAADAGGEPVGWAALLRGDADLHRLFELLRPVALAAEADELGGVDESGDREAAALRAAAERLYRAAELWTTMTAAR